MSVPYIDGSGAIRQRKSASGDGTNTDPDVFSFADQGTYDRLGTTSDSPISTPTANGTLSAVIRGLWQNLLGTASEASSPTGSIHAKLRSLADVIGAISDAAARSGSLMAMLRSLAESNFVESQTATNVTIGTSLTTVITFDCRGKSTLGVQLQNTGSEALSALQVQARFNSNLNIWNTIASTNADFTTSNGKQGNNASTEIINSGVSSGTMITIPGGGDGWFRMRCNGMESVRIQAQVASGTTTMLSHGIAEV
ncbi:hypothetical protein NIES592_08260 [Fischerella major NIES-592]|uniref:Uncharacterized protein n=1 Tax=Fischerella major NIES-592 TaxID=210994 RepID=A0A1U7H1L4_9CYAN|nr:hypothetical protein [Fischerella major]OKH14860.1 hypothetical protein NIES592_08260 [Fischerella major NIES-592]